MLWSLGSLVSMYVPLFLFLARPCPRANHSQFPRSDLLEHRLDSKQNKRMILTVSNNSALLFNSSTAGVERIFTETPGKTGQLHGNFKGLQFDS